MAEQHPYLDFVPQGTEILIIGTTPPPRFYKYQKKLFDTDVDFYYGSNRNHFWRILGQVFNTKFEFENTDEAVEQRKDFLTKHKMGITDMVDCLDHSNPNSALDSDITNIKFRDVWSILLEQVSINKIFFTSHSQKNSAKQLFLDYLNQKGLSDGYTKLDNKEIILLNNHREIELSSLISPSGRVAQSEKRLKQYQSSFLKHITPEWTTPKGIVLVYPEKLPLNRSVLTDFYNVFIQKLIDEVAIEQIFIIHRPSLKEKLNKLFHNSQKLIFFESSSVQDIWVRDFAPIFKNKQKVVKALYNPSYFKKEHEKYAEFDDKLGIELAKELGYIVKRLESKNKKLALDGGNFVHNGKGTAIVSNRVIGDNETWSIQEVEKLFLNKLNISNLIFVPVEPDDFTGHIDGSIRFINENTLLITKYSENYPIGRKHFETLVDFLEKKETSLKIKRVNSYVSSEKNKADGIYLNYLRLGNTVLLPQFKNQDKYNEEAFLFFKTNFPNITTLPIDVPDELVSEGGCLNCISWVYY
jgi:agmatine deiminase